MTCEFYQKGCLIGGLACMEAGMGDNNCPEAARFRSLEKTKCPLTKGDQCDLPVCWRGILGNNVPCHIGKDCIFGSAYLNLREKANSDKQKFNHVEFIQIAARVRNECRQIKQQECAA